MLSVALKMMKTHDHNLSNGKRFTKLWFDCFDIGDVIIDGKSTDIVLMDVRPLLTRGLICWRVEWNLWSLLLLGHHVLISEFGNLMPW
ncbi:uncharacterized protein LOC123883618 isoform X2 [Trifolium pratense]|uniref:uncharacterized protein LOC123883618 isoform X2 n=1 Tax=Trifolium pratense TaxID=57577 RepID=UPI001E6935E4|nr:uncharacterized protein LOC123883618 isoform X2 [Trifolium pratense]